MRFVFKSISKPNHRWAIYDGESPAYNFRMNCRLSRHVSIFDTMGDGEVQHAPDLCVDNSWEYMSDFVNSVIPVASQVRDGGILNSLLRVFVPVKVATQEQVQFVSKLRYDSDKPTQYVNFKECKKSSAESKRHHRQWEKVDSGFTGGLDGFLYALHKLDCMSYLDPIQATYTHIKACRLADWSIYELARNYASVNMTVFSGVTTDEIREHMSRVEWIGDYLRAREECRRSEELFERLSREQLQVA